MSLLNNVRLLLLASWLGAAVFFSGAVAPSAFRILRAFELANAGEIAGAIVNRTLSIVNISGFILGLLLLLTAFALKQRYERWSFIVQIILLSVMVVGCGLGEWVIAAKIRVLRATIHTTVDQLPAGDPSRVAFDALHGYSVTALSIAIIAGLIAFFVVANRAR